MLKITVSGSSQPNIGDINLEKWSNSSMKPSSSVTLQTLSLVNGSSFGAITPSMTSFTDTFDEVVLSCWLSSFFLKLYLSSIFPKSVRWCQYLDASLLDVFGCDA